jgi:hypothetical protein
VPDAGDDDLTDIVPAVVVAARPPRDLSAPRAPSAPSFARLLRRHVVVVAGGITYRGLLHGADDTDLYLRGELRWFVLPLDTVRAVEPDAERPADGEHEAHGDDDDDDAARRVVSRRSER